MTRPASIKWLIRLCVVCPLAVFGCEGQPTENNAPTQSAAQPASEPVSETVALPSPIPRADPQQAAPSVFLDRTAIVGASVSAGFGSTMCDGPIIFSAVLDGMLPESAEPVPAFATPFFFTAPDRFGPQLAEQAIAYQPTAIIAVDFLFWYAYGSMFRVEDETQARLDRFERGLELAERLLDETDAHIVLGRIPDMSDAIGLMLSRSQVPSDEARRAINSRLESWAIDKPRVRLLPLDELVAGMKASDGFSVMGERWSRDEARRLLLADNLHATGLGLVLVGRYAVATLLDLDDQDADLSPQTIAELSRHVCDELAAAVR